MSDAEEHYRKIKEEIITGFIPGDVLVFFYPSMAVEEIEVKEIDLVSRTIIGYTNHQDNKVRKNVSFDDFIKYGTLLMKGT